MSAINDILWLLKDGKWHTLEEITTNLELPQTKTDLAVNFLAEYNFIQLNKTNEKAKLHPSTLEFVTEIQQLENEASNH
jgi:predicted transcriptional regulator